MDITAYKQSTLRDHPELFDETISLIEDSLDYDENQRFEVDFAPLMTKENHSHCHLLLKDRKVIGHIGVKLRQFGDKNVSTPVALVGGISIDKNYRGKGLFKKFFKSIELRYKNDVSLFILWSNLDSFYKKFGFYQAGALVQSGDLLFDESPISKKFQKVRFDQLDHKTFDCIKKIYYEDIEKRYATLKRDEISWKYIAKIHTSNLYLYHVKNKVVGYFFINKGQDLQSVIHEASCLKQYKEDFINLLLPYKLWLAENESIKHSDKTLFYSAIFKISNLKLFNRFLETWSKKEAMVEEITTDYIRFTHQDKSFCVSPGEFYTFLFGPSKIVEFENYGSPLYFSGLDSI